MNSLTASRKAKAGEAENALIEAEGEDSKRGDLMKGSERAPTHATTSDFVKTHCRICAAGQTITRLQGGKGTYCLLLREWMSDKHGDGTISDCDRFEVKDSLDLNAGSEPLQG